MSLANLTASLEAEVEQLDVMDEQDAFRKAEELAIDLEAIRDELLSHEGVNRQLAAAMESIQAGIIPEEYPLNSFTKAHSKTNYKVSQEAIDIALAAALGVFVGAMLAVLARLLKWMHQALFASTKSAQKAEVAGKNVTTLAEEIVRLEQVMNKDDRSRAEVKTKEVIEKANKELSDMHNDLLRDLLSGGKIRSTMLAAGSRIDVYFSAINEKFKLFEALIKQAGSQQSESTKVAMLAQIAGLIKEIPATGVSGQVDSLTGTKTGGSVKGSLTALHDFVVHAKESRSTPAFKYQTMVELVRAGRMKLNETYLPNAEKTLGNIEALDRSVTKANNALADKKGVDADLAAGIRQAGNLIKAELDAMRQFISLIRDCISTVNSATAVTFRTVTAVYQLIVAEAANSAQETIKDQARRSREEIRGKLQRE